jgi:glycosyltransferase involved in cell wall biosynthesis
MIIDWISVAPWVPSGYGSQTALQVPLLAQDHQVFIAASYGLRGSPQTWQAPDGTDIRVWPAVSDEDLISQYRFNEADLAIALFDAWAGPLDFLAASGASVAIWLPVDCTPMSVPDMHRIRKSTGITPIAMSRHGRRMLKDAGFDPLYVPHSIDTQLFRPEKDRQELKKALGLDPDAFVIGINAANADSLRKGFAEQLMAFKTFHQNHPNSILLLHTGEIPSEGQRGVHLGHLLRNLKLEGAAHFTDQFRYESGLISPTFLQKWYNTLNLLSACSYGEGFGIPIIEAQACGTPVVVTDVSAMPELLFNGWKVDGQPQWNAFHNAWWKVPNVLRILNAYESAYENRGEPNEAELSRAGRDNIVKKYDMHFVYEKFWRPTLHALESRYGKH